MAVDEQRSSEALTPRSSDVDAWLSLIDEATKDMRDYDRQVEKIRKKYRYEDSLNNKGKRRFALLWSNTEILKPAVYAKAPAPAVTSRWKDGDPVVRITSELLERNLDFQTDICDYSSTFEQVRDEYLLMARGICRLRYEPTFDTDEVDPEDDGFSAGKPEDEEVSKPEEYEEGEPDTEADTGPEEVLKFENIHLDFVHAKDFIHPKARTWKELPWLAFTSYMDRDALEKRFPKKWKDGKTVGESVKLDVVDDGDSRDKERGRTSGIPARKATVYEIWNKQKKRVLWISPGFPETMDDCAPYLRLEGFWPCPRPAYGTLATDSLVPIPDYVFYQDQAEEINSLTQRIASLTESLKLVGFYPAGPEGQGSPEIEIAVKPGFENKMIAVKSWAAFAAAGAKTGIPIVFLPVEEVGAILKGCVELRKQLIDDVYQLTGISDIMRGDTEAEETAAAQGIKSKWGSVRVDGKQRELARLARDVMRMAAEIMAAHFDVASMAKTANMKIPTEAEQQEKIQQYQIALRAWTIQQKQQSMMGHNGGPPMGAQSGVAPPPGPPPQGAPINPGPPQGGMAGSPAPAPSQPPPPQIVPTIEQIEELLRDGVARRFLVDIESDSTILSDEDAEKHNWAEFIEAISKFIVAWLPLVQQTPEFLPVAAELLMSAVRRFRIGRESEEVIEQALDKLQAASGQPKPPSGEQLKAQADLQKAKAEIEKAQIDAQAQAQKAKADIAMVQLKGKQAQEEHDLSMQRMQLEAHLDQQKAQMQLQTERAKLGMQHQLETQKMQHQQRLADQQAQITSAQLDGQHVLEHTKTQNQQKTLAQQAQMDEQKMVAAQAMDQFKAKNARDVIAAKADASMPKPDAGPEAPKRR